MKHCIIAVAVLLMTVTARTEAPEGRFWEIGDLETRYIAQIARLRASGYPEMFGGSEWFEERFRVNGWGHAPSLYTELRDACPLWVNDGNIPFLIVIPEECAPRAWQATRVMAGGLRSDAPAFRTTGIKNTEGIATPTRAPYLIFNVNPGTAAWQTSVRNAEWSIADRRQRGLTFDEGIALLLHYPDTVKCGRGIDENYKEHFTSGRCVFLAARCNGACPADPTTEEFVTFRVRKNAESGFTRGYYTLILRRDMTPNLEHYIFPSCDTIIAPEKK